MAKATTFGGKVREIREAKRFSIASCADQANMKPSQWSRLEADEPRREDGSPPIPRAETVGKVVSALNLNLAFEQERRWLRELYSFTPYLPPAVVEPIREREPDADSPDHLAWLEGLPPGNRTREEIEDYIRFKRERYEGRDPRNE